MFEVKKERKVASEGFTGCYRNHPGNDFTQDFGDGKPVGKIIGPVQIEGVTVGFVNAIVAKDINTSKILNIMFSDDSTVSAALIALNNKSSVYLYVKETKVEGIEFCK